MSSFFDKSQSLISKIKEKIGLSEYKKDLRDDIQAFYEGFIIPYQTDPLNQKLHQINQQSYDQVIKSLYEQFIQILKYTPNTFQDNDVQQMRYFILDKIMEDSKKPIQPINAELIETLNNIIQEDNNKNSLLGIKAIFHMMNCQYLKLMNNTLRHEVTPFGMVTNEVLDYIQLIVKQFLYHKMQNFQNLKNIFQQQKDKSQFNHYLREQNQQQPGGSSAQSEVAFIESKYDLRIYEEMTATVSTIIIFFGTIQKYEPVSKQADTIQRIKSIIDIIKRYLKLGVEAIANTNFDYTQQEFNRKFHEDLGSIHRRMISYFQMIFKDFSQLDNNSSSAQMISDLLKATASYLTKFPDEYLDIKISLYKEYQKILYTQTMFSDKDLSKVALSYTEVFQMDKIVSNYSKIEIISIYLKIIKNIFLFDMPLPAPQPNQRPVLKPHQSTKIQSITEQMIYTLVDKSIDNIIGIIYDNDINIPYMNSAIDILNQLFTKYYTLDQEYFKRNQPPTSDNLLKKINLTEDILRFIGNKYKDINNVFVSINTFLKKQFIKSQQPQKPGIQGPPLPPVAPQQIQHQQLHNPSQQSSQQQSQQSQQGPQQPQQGGNHPQQIQRQQGQPQIMQRQRIPNNPSAAAAAQNISKIQQQVQTQSGDDEATFQKKFTEWIQKKRNHTTLSAFPKMQRLKRTDTSELQKIQSDILENEDFYSFQPIETPFRQYTKEEIQLDFEGEFQTYFGFDIKRENLQWFFSEISNLFKVINAMQFKYQSFMISFNQEYKKYYDQGKPMEKYNLSANQIIILRKIFKNGLELFTNYHQMCHIDMRFPETSLIRRFIANFAQIEHECHFKDIIEPNFKNILKLLIKTSQDSDKCQCFKSITEMAFYKYDQSNPNNPPSYFSTANFFNHILLKNLFLIVDQQNETLDPFNEFYSLYKNKFFEIIQLLIDRVFTGIIAQYDNDSYKQIIKKSILFLFKKIHTSPYPLEYMKILKWFAHQLNEQSQKSGQKDIQIRLEIQSICQSSDRFLDGQIDSINAEINSCEDQLQKEMPDERKAPIKERLKRLKESSKNFEGINILDNYMQLLELNCSKFQVQIAKIYLCLAHLMNLSLDIPRKKQVAKILLICMSLSERNMATRALTQLEQMTQKLQKDEVEIILEDIKDELIDRLYQIASENRPIDLTNKDKELQKIQTQQQQGRQSSMINHNFNLQDNSKIAFRILSKISFLAKQHKIHTFLFENEQAPELQEKIYVEFDIFHNKNGAEEKSNLKLDVKQSVEHSINLFNRIINNYNNQPMKSNVIEISFAMIKFCVVKYFCRSDNLDIQWLFENENGIQIQEQLQQQQHQQQSSQQQNPLAADQSNQQLGNEIMQEEFEVKKKILRELNFKSSDFAEAEQELESKVASLFGSGSSPNENSSNLLILRLLKVLMDLVSIDQKAERDQGLLLKIRRESERILSVVSRVLSQNLIDSLIHQHGINPANVSNYFKQIFLDKNNPHYIFISTLVKSLKNQNFMERKTNTKMQPCNEKQFLWNELFIKNIYKYLSTDGTKVLMQHFQASTSSSQSMEKQDPSPRTTNNVENESGKQSIESMMSELENFVITQITKEIANNNDSFVQTTNSKQFFFPSTASSEEGNSDFPKNVMGSSIISSHNFESPTESRIFDNNNNSLNKRFCLVECLNEVMNIFRAKVIGQHISNILDSAFIISNNLPEIVNLQSMQDFCQLLIKKILQYIKKQKDQYNLSSAQMRKILQTFVNNLTTCKPISHIYSRNALNSIAKIHGTNVLSILYLSSNANNYQKEDIRFCDQFDNLITQAKKEDDLADNLANSQQLEQMPSRYDIQTLQQNHPTLFISQLLQTILKSISFFQEDYTYNSYSYYTQNSFTNRKILCIFNCFRTLEYLLVSENCLPFRLVVLHKPNENPNQQQDPNQPNMQQQQQQRLPLSFLFEKQALNIINSSLKILEKNNRELKTSRIILPQIQNPYEAQQQQQQQAHNPAHPPPPPNYQQPVPAAGQPPAPHQHMPQIPPGNPNQPVQQAPPQGVLHNSGMQIPQRTHSMNESGFAGGPQVPPPNRVQNGQMIPPQNQPPNHPNMPQNNRMIPPYANNPQGNTPMNQSNSGPPPPPTLQPQRAPYMPGQNMPPPPQPAGQNNPNFPPNSNYYNKQGPNQPPPLGQPGRNIMPAPPNNMPQQQGRAGGNPMPIQPQQQQQMQPQQMPPQQPQKQNQNSYINQCQLFYEDELGLNIEDLNFNLKNWAKLISSIALFLKSINLSTPQKYFHSIIDKEERRLQEVSGPNFIKLSNEFRVKASEAVEEIKYQILIKLYDLMPRIEKTIHSNVQECINEINKKNGNNTNKMALEEEKLKLILRPVLFCLQQSFKRFTPQFLLIFKKILKMLVNCFNVKLITLLINNLDTIIKDTSLPANEQSFSDYKIKNISGLLSLFQHLKNSLYQHTKGTKEAASSKEQIKQIINKTIKIQENYSVRYGWFYVEQKTLKPIAKLLNVQTDFITEILMKDKRGASNQQQQQFQPPIEGLSEQALEFIYKILKMDQSFELRECLTREYHDQDFFIRFYDPSKPLLIQLKIIYLLAKKSSRVFTKNKIDGIKFLIDESKKIPQPPNISNIKNYVLFMKLFVLYFQRKRDINVLVCIINSYNERFPCSHFLKRFFEEQVPALLQLDQKKKLLQTTLSNMCTNMDVNTIRIYFKLIIKPIIKSLTKEQMIQINYFQSVQNRQSMIDYFFDIQKKFDERFKRFQNDVKNIPMIQQQMQQVGQQTPQFVQMYKEIQRTIRNNDRFSKELVLLEMCRILFLFGKELKPEMLKTFIGHIEWVISQNLEQSENPIIKQLYYQLQIKIIKLHYHQGDGQRKKLILTNIFKNYNFNEQEQNKNYFVQLLVTNNINYFIKHICNVKPVRFDKSRLALPPNQQNALPGNPQSQHHNQQGQQQQGNQMNQQSSNLMNRGMPPQMQPGAFNNNFGPSQQQIPENKVSYDIIREFLEADKDKIIFTSLITYNEYFYEIRDTVSGDIFKELKEYYSSFKTKFKKESSAIKEFFKTQDDENGALIAQLELKNNDAQKSQTIYNLINTYVSWKLREQKEELKSKSSSNNQENIKSESTDIPAEKKFGKRAIYLLILFILDATLFDDRLLELYQVLLKKCILIWNLSEINYKMIKYKYMFNMLRLENSIYPQSMQQMNPIQQYKGHMSRYFNQLLNVLNICLECSFDGNYNYQFKHILKILNWTPQYSINKSKQRNKNPSTSAVASTGNAAPGASSSAAPNSDKASNAPSGTTTTSTPGSANPNAASTTPNQVPATPTSDGNMQGGQPINKPPQPGQQQRKAVVKEKKEHLSLMNINENDSYLITMTSNILYSLLDVCEEDSHAKQSQEFKRLLFSQIKWNIEGHHFQIDGQEKQIQDNEPPMSIDLMVKLIMYYIKLDMRDDLSSIRLNQILMILENQNKQHKTREEDRIQTQENIYYENFFCPKYAHYIPKNSSLYFETSKTSSTNLLNKFCEEKIETDPTQDDQSSEQNQQSQNKKNKYVQLLKREAGFEVNQCDIDKSLKYCQTLFREHQEFFEFPTTRIQHNKYSQAQNLNGLMYISLCLIPIIKENKQDTLSQYVKRILKVLFNVIDEGALYSLRIEALNLLRTFFLGRENFPNKEVPQRYNMIEKVINILPLTTKEEVVKWVFVFQDIEKKYRKFPRQFYYAVCEEIGYVNITRIAEENIQFYFFKFLVDILKLTEGTLKNISPIELRKYLLLFSKIASSDHLEYFFNTIDSNENLNELNTMLLLLGQSKYEEKLNDRVQNREVSDDLQTHLQKDEGEIPYYENDDVYLFAFKFLLFKIKKISQTTNLVFKNFTQFPKFTITQSTNQTKKSQKNLLYEDVLELMEEVHEFDGKRQLEWILECVQDMMQSCTRKTTIANDFKSMELIDEFRYIVLAQQNVSKFTPLNIQLIQPTFLTLIKFLVDSCETRAMKVLVYQSIEEYLLHFSSHTYNTYANRAYSIPGCSQNEDRRLSKNWAYALFQVFFFEFDAKNPYILNANKVYQIIKTHHCWDIGLVYLEKVIELMNEGSCDADIQVYEKIQQIYQDLGDTDSMYGVMNQLVKNDNLRKAISLAQQREFQQVQQALIGNIDKLNENDQSFCNLYSSYTQDYETLYFISTYRQLFIETQKNLNEWDTLITLSKTEQNDHLLTESTYYSLNKNLLEVNKVLDKEIQIVKELKAQERFEYQNFYFQPSFMYHHVHILKMFQQRTQVTQINHSIQKAGIQLAYEWASLPKTITKAHFGLITQFQTITELEEANIVFGKLRSDEQRYFQVAFQTFYQMIQQWRERLPHKYDSLISWKTLVNQREFIYNIFYQYIKEKLNMQDRNGSAQSAQQQNTSQPLPKQGKDIILQYIDSDWNNYQYFKILQNYGITNTNLLPPKRNEFFSLEDQFLRLKCLMRNWLIDSTSVNEESITEIQKIFTDSLQRYNTEILQKQRNPEFKIYFEQFQQQIILKESQILFKKNKNFDTIQNIKNLLAKPHNLYKTCYTYLEICFSLRAVKNHPEYFNRMTMTFLIEALKYKPYYSRLYFVLFFSPEFLNSNLEEIRTLDTKSFHNSLIMWLPKILQTYQKFKAQANKNYSSAFERLLQPFKYYEQYLFLTIRSYLPSQSVLMETYNTLRNQFNTCKKIESVLRILQSFLIVDFPQKHFGDFGLKYQEINFILDQIQNAPNLQGYYDFLNTKGIPLLNSIIQTFNDTIPDMLGISNTQQFINPQSLPNQVIEFIRVHLYAPLIKHYNSNKQSFASEYSIKSLLAFQHDAQDIEIPGQYVCNNPRIFREFTPKNHIFMSSLQKEVETQLSYRKLTKKISINASNCKQYVYEIDYEFNNHFQYGQSYPLVSAETQTHRLHEISILQQCLNSQFFQQRETFSRNLKISQRYRIPLDSQKFNATISLKSSSRTLNSMQTVHDWYLTHYCSEHDSQHIDKFNMHLNYFDFNDPSAANLKMRDIVKGNALVQFVLSKCNTYQEYLDLRKEFSYNYSAAAFSHYLMGQNVGLQDILFDYNSGEVFIESKNLEVRNNQVIYKNPHAIRVSPAIAKFVGQIGISGILCSSFVSMAKSITQKEIPMMQVLQSIVEDLLQTNNMPDDKQVHEKMIQKILWIYCQDYLTNNYSKNELGTRVFTIFELIQENQNNIYNSISHKYWF